MAEKAGATGSAPDAAGKTEEAPKPRGFVKEGEAVATVQTASKRLSMEDAIAQEMAALKKTKAPEELAEKKEAESEADEDSEKELEAKEDGEDEGDDSDDSSEDEDSDESDSDDEKDNARIPKARLNKEIEKTKKWRAKAEEFEAMIGTLKERDEERAAKTGEYEKISTFIDSVIEASEYLPALREALQNLPILNGKEPTLDDFESAEKYADWREKQVEKKYASKQTDSGQAEAQEKEISKIFDGFESEIKELRSDKSMEKYMDEAHMDQIRAFIEEQGIASLLSGNKRFDSVKKIARFLFIDEMTADLKKSGAEEAIKKIDQGRKKVSFKSKPAAEGAKPLPRTASVMEHARAIMAESRAGVD